MCNQISRYNICFCIIFPTIVFPQRRGCFLCDAFIPSSFEKVRIFSQRAVNLACLIKFIVSEDYSASQTDGTMKRQRVRRQRTERDDKSINEMKILHMAQQPSAFQWRNTQVRCHIR